MASALAERLRAIGPRIKLQDESDPWYLAWQLMTGASYSLLRATALLPHSCLDQKAQTRVLIQALSEASLPDEAAIPTWLLGYYLNSADFRIQSALHRLLKAYTGEKKGDAAALAQKALDAGGLDPEASTILSGFAAKSLTPGDPGHALKEVHVRVNSLKHDPGQDPSDRLGFVSRASSAEAAALELACLLERLGTKVNSIAAA